MTLPTIPRPPVVSPSPVSPHAAAPGRPGRHPSLLRGRPEDPSWARPSLLLLLATTAVLYLWNLGSSGWANSYYAAAVQAGTQSWQAFLFGSLDAGNAITVDKTPASLWVMELSGRLFGFNSWSMLAPQALEGVAAVALLYAVVRRVSGPAAGLLAGAGLALTPVAALMFRFNNPDALLTLLLVAAAYCTVRALERAAGRAGTSWLILAGVCLGFGFLTKMLQAFLVLPALAITYLLFADGRLRRRIGQLLAAGAALIVSAGWWVALVELWPTSSRPYVGGSTNNSVLELALGYNGLSRILGNTGGGPSGASGGGPGGGGPGGGGNTGFGGDTGILRLFGDAFGTEISWLLPAALIALVAVLWTTRRAPRTDLTRASVVLWGLWMITTGLVFSYMSGTVHPYYAIALAPAIAALVAIGGHELWRNRRGLLARSGLALMVAATGTWSVILLGRTPDWYPWIRYALIPLTAVSVLALMLTTARARTRLAGVVLAGSLVTGLAATGAYAVQTTALPHSGSLPTSGPTATSLGGQPGGGPGGTSNAARPGGMPGGAMPGGAMPGGAMPGGAMPGGAMPGGMGQPPGSGTSSNGNTTDGTTTDGTTTDGTTTDGTTSDGTTSNGTSGSSSPNGTGSSNGSTGGMPSGAPADMGATSTNSALVALLQKSTTRWAAATTGALNAASLELASGASVIGIGGFLGSDPAPTLAQFQAWAKAGLIHYYVVSAGGAGGGPGGGMGGDTGGSGAASEIRTWVEAHYTATTVGTATVYDLTSPTS
jgi:4-amino-4-deoxy-L-arabinose transferase-like glycosyltransferase